MCALDRSKPTSHQEKDESEKSGNLSLDEISEMFRKVCFAKRNRLAEAPCEINPPENQQRALPSGNDLVDSTALDEKEGQNQQPHSPVLALSYAHENGIFAAALKRFLHEKYFDIKIGEGEAKSSARLSLLDEADLIVPFISPAYLSAKHLVDELNIALFRHRSSSNQVVFPVRVAELPEKPAYVHLIPCEFSLLDIPWSLEHYNVCPAEVKRVADELGLAYDIVLYLRNVADAIVEKLKESKNDSCGQVLFSPAEIKHDLEALKKKKKSEICERRDREENVKAKQREESKSEIVLNQLCGEGNPLVEKYAAQDASNHSLHGERKDLTCLPEFGESQALKQREESKGHFLQNQTCVEEKPLVDKSAAQNASNHSLHCSDVEEHSDTVERNPRSNTCHIV